MLSSFQPAPSRQRKALLLFADSPHTDCRRRGWPAAFGILFEARNLTFGPGEDFDQHLFTARTSRRLTSLRVEIHEQAGASFGQRLHNAVEGLALLGYEQIVIIGQDCPDLEPADIRHAFALLDTHRLVLGPDHRGGCYLIGIHGSDRGKLQGVQWQRNTDFRALLDRFGSQNTFRLSVKMDLDTWGDVRLLAGSASRWRRFAEFLLGSQSPNGADAFRAQERDPILCQRKDWQLPPPFRSFYHAPSA